MTSAEPDPVVPVSPAVPVTPVVPVTSVLTVTAGAGISLLLDECGDLTGLRTLVIDCPGAGERLRANDISVTTFTDGLPPTRATPTPASSPTDSAPLGDQPPAGPFDRMLIGLPRSLDQLDEYCTWAHASGVQQISGVGSQRQLVRAMNDVLARRYAKVWASRGRGKYRVLHAADPLPGDRVVHLVGWPRTATRQTPLGPMQVCAHGGTFGGHGLDAGTALLISTLVSAFPPASSPARPGWPRRVLEVGCGNGSLTVALARLFPQAELTAVDVSWAAVAATRASLRANAAQAEVIWADGLDLVASGAAGAGGGAAVGEIGAEDAGAWDLIVTNPPFHAAGAKDSAFTRRLLTAVPARLRPSGEFWLVHNSHLPWLELLQRQSATPDRSVSPDQSISPPRSISPHRSMRAERIAQDRFFSVVRCRVSASP